MHPNDDYISLDFNVHHDFRLLKTLWYWCKIKYADSIHNGTKVTAQKYTLQWWLLILDNDVKRNEENTVFSVIHPGKWYF